jgi:HAD superfamily hydrolase (TIGR01509 family)
VTATRVRALQAVIFDVDGTLAETERDGHRVAFNKAFRDHELPYQWSVTEYGELLRVTGGRRRLVGYLGTRGHDDAEATALAKTLHAAKTEYFRQWIRSGCIQARPGVQALVHQLTDLDIRLAVVTTGSSAWVHPLLEQLFEGVRFAAIVTGGDVDELKPHPEGYLQALDRLGLDPTDAMAIEDSTPGLEAALAARLPCVVVTSAYTRGDAFPGAIAVVPGYLAMNMFGTTGRGELSTGVTAGALVRLHARQRWI